MTKEHPFIEALGGRATIQVCNECNSTIGHSIEAPMMAHDQLLNLARVAHLNVGKPLRGRISGEDQDVAYDLVRRDLRSDKPVKRWEHSEVETEAQLAGSPEQIRRVLTGGMAEALGLTNEEVERKIREAPRGDSADMWMESKLTHSIPLGHRLAAKVALGAGVLADDTFANTGLAAVLRKVLSGNTPLERTIQPMALDTVTAMVQGALPPGVVPLEPLGVADQEGTSRVVFVPLGRDRTGVFSYLVGLLVFIEGMVLEAPCPLDELGISITDGSPPVVRRVMAEVLQRFADASEL